MKIESEYEKENQNKIEKNREDFFENVKLSAEAIFNDYLKTNFHTTYNQYRNEEMLQRDDEAIRIALRGLNYQQQQDKQPKNILPLLVNSSKLNEIDETKSGDRGMDYDNDEDPDGRTVDSDDVITESFLTTSSKAIVKFDKKSNGLKQKPTWYIELNKEQFYRDIKLHLTNLFIENDKIEDKDKPAAMLIKEDIWSYPNALLYSATVITTIGKILIFNHKKEIRSYFSYYIMKDMVISRQNQAQEKF